MSRRPELPDAAVAALACPVCAGPLAVGEDGGVLRCPAGHSYDRARQGHVTLLPPGHRAPSGDSAEMVADRVAFLDAGHYAGISAALGDAVLEGGGAEPRRLLDLGGGTGHHLAAVLDRAPGASGLVLDSSPFAARRAARAHPRAMAVVADTWARLPVRDGGVDRVLVVFAPRNGPEIARVLDPAGRLVVVTPAADHLGELIGPLGLLRVDPDKAARLAGSLEPHLVPVASTERRDVLRLHKDDVGSLVGMGPHVRHLSADIRAGRIAALPERVEVTVAVRVAVYRRPDRPPAQVRM